MKASTVLSAATMLPDSQPRQVVTPYKVDAIEDHLRSLGILEHWLHVVEGIRHGFRVGVSELLLKSFIFENHASAELVRNFTHVLVLCVHTIHRLIQYM